MMFSNQIPKNKTMIEMKIEIALNTLDHKEWWFDLGIGYQSTDYYEYKKVLTIGLGIATIYFRFLKTKQ